MRVVAALACLAFAAANAHAALTITNAVIIDGTGSPARPGSVRMEGDRIAAIGELKPASGDTVLDAHGLVLAPGFIDTHSHHDEQLLELRDARAAVSQGITTIVAGQDGESSLPLREFFAALEKTAVAINVASYSGHGTLRSRVMRADFRRAATAQEVAAMVALLDQDMADGALGLATGLEYEPGAYATTDELVTLAQVAGRRGGRYISHIRSEDYRLDEAIAEIVEIGRRACVPVQVSHIKVAMIDRWGDAPAILEVLDAARSRGVDVTADVYPYDAWQSTMKVLFPKHDYTNRASATFALQHVARPEDLTLSAFEPDPSLAGMTLAAVAARRGVDPETALMDLIRLSEAAGPDGGEEYVIGRSMQESDIAALVAWPHSNFSSDGALVDAHPRGAGAFTKALRTYVREQKLLTLEQAVHKMTELSAQHVGIADRGVIRAGAYADLVLFDPSTVTDHATFAAPAQLSAGIAQVWINGHAVWRDGRATGAHPGQVVRRPPDAKPGRGCGATDG